MEDTLNIGCNSDSNSYRYLSFELIPAVFIVLKTYAIKAQRSNSFSVLFQFYFTMCDGLNMMCRYGVNQFIPTIAAVNKLID